MILIWYHLFVMKLITRDTDYAMRALIFIAGSKKEIVSVSQLVAALRIPKPFLRKLMQVLNKKGLLKSYKGRAGGFLLAKPENRINLIDLVNIFQGGLKLNDCLFKKSICPEIKVCALRKKIDNIQTYVASQLRPITVATLSRKGR